MTERIDRHIEYSIKEDIRTEDHSAAACIPMEASSSARLIIKESGILAGVHIAQRVFQLIDSKVDFVELIPDGEAVEPGQIAFTVSGHSRALLKGERLALNYMQRMSGIATQTRAYVDKVQGTKAKILDTRKTSPGLRQFEKMAVKFGGGDNHRMGLYDMIMIKDNHIDFAGGIDKAMDAVDHYLKLHDLDLPVEVEARDLNEVEKILSNGKANRIMFDNFNYEDTRSGVNMVNGNMETESSGGINLDTVREYALCGVDYISVGALTHQIKSLDMSLKAN